jgi:hypothetical protein
MLPIFLSLGGVALSVYEKLFLGWFGPRGLASILFALLIVKTFSGSGRRGTPGLRGADGDAEYRPPRCDGEADVGVVRSQPGRGLDHAVEGT